MALGCGGDSEPSACDGASAASGSLHCGEVIYHPGLDGIGWGRAGRLTGPGGYGAAGSAAAKAL